MKKYLMTAFMAAILFSMSNISAGEGAGAGAEGSTASRGSALVSKVRSFFPTVSLTSSRQWVANNRWAVGGTAAVVVGLGVMYKTCPWFRKLIDCEETATRRTRSLDSRVTRSRAE